MTAELLECCCPGWYNRHDHVTTTRKQTLQSVTGAPSTRWGSWCGKPSSILSGIPRVLTSTNSFEVILSGVGASAAAPRSLAGLSLATGWIITGVKWGNESWSRPDSVGVSTTSAAPALPRWSLACSARLTMAYTIKGWSRPLLLDHVELAASEQAQCYAARERQGCADLPGAECVIRQCDAQPAAPGRLGHHCLAAAAPAYSRLPALLMQLCTAIDSD